MTLKTNKEASEIIKRGKLNHTPIYEDMFNQFKKKRI